MCMAYTDKNRKGGVKWHVLCDTQHYQMQVWRRDSRGPWKLEKPFGGGWDSIVAVKNGGVGWTGW